MLKLTFFLVKVMWGLQIKKYLKQEEKNSIEVSVQKVFNLTVTFGDLKVKEIKILSIYFEYELIYIVYQKALIRTFLTRLHNNLCEFTALEFKFNILFCTQKPVLNIRFKDFWYTKINLTQIWYDEFN